MKKQIILITALLFAVNVIGQTFRDSHNADSTLRYSHLNFKEKIHFMRDLLRDEYLDEIEEEELWLATNLKGFTVYNKLGIGSEVLRVYHGVVKYKTIEELKNIDFKSIHFEKNSFNFFVYNNNEDSIDLFAEANRGPDYFFLTSAYKLQENQNIPAMLNYAKEQGWDKQKLYIFGILYNPTCDFFYYNDLYVCYLGEIMLARDFFNNVRYSNEFKAFLKSMEDFK